MTPKAAQKLIELHAGEKSSLLDDETLFLIDTNYIGYFDNGLTDPECRDQLIDLFSRKNKWLKISDAFKTEFDQGVSFDEIKKELEFTRPNQVHFAEFEGLCIDLTEGITLKKDDYIDRDFFDFFFAFRLSRKDLSRIKDFLSFNLKIHFNSDIRDFKAFLENVIVLKHATLLGDFHLTALSNILKIGEMNEPNDTPAHATKKYTQAQIALSIYYRQAADSLPIWVDGTKEKELKKIADDLKLSPNKLQKAYNKFSKKGSVAERLSFIAKMKNRTAIETILEGDTKAIAEFKIEVIKTLTRPPDPSGS